jgi:hypothetical protein
LEKYFKTPIPQQKYKGSVGDRFVRQIPAEAIGRKQADCFRRQILTKFMVNAKKILITTESHEIYVLRNTSEAPLRSYCAGCGEETEFLTIDDAVCTSRASTIDLMAMYRLGRLHTAEAASGHLLVCRESLKTLCYGDQ